MNKLLSYFGGDDLAAEVWSSKYALRDEDLTMVEETPDDMHRRMAKEFAKIEIDYSQTEDDSKQNFESLSHYGQNRDFLTEDKIYNYFKDFKYIVPQGSVMSMAGNPYQIGSLSNCFVIEGAHDSYGGICHTDEEQVQLMKRRGGVGHDLSRIRPKNSLVKNAARSSTGLVSYAERYSNSTREVAQEGRRGALMLTCDIRHPDVADFIECKADRTSVTGANISVMVRDDFMLAMDNGDDYILRWPCNTFEDILIDIPYNEIYTGENGAVIKKVKTEDLFDKIVHNAHDNAEPGVIFIDRHHDYSPDGVYKQYKMVTTNPCGEIGMQPNDACRLLAINLYPFVINPFMPDAYIDEDKLYEVCYETMRLGDDLVDMEIERIQQIIKKIKYDPEPTAIIRTELELWEKIRKECGNSRRTGCGFTALGDMLAALSIAYDSDLALSTIEKVMKIKLQAELDCTIDLAILRGTFKGWDPELEFEMDYDPEGTSNMFIDKGMNDFYEMLRKDFIDQAIRMQQYGRRNVSWSTVAPTGTVSLLTQTTSGLEPLFKPFYIRRKKGNPSDKDFRVDFTDQNGDNWMEFWVLHPKFKDWIHRTHCYDLSAPQDFSEEELTRLFNESPWAGSTANEIDWIRRVEMQSVIQKYTTHSISSTINLPTDVSKDKIKEIYCYAWDKGLKGITVYREGSRSGVLVDASTVNEKFSYADGVRRPKDLPGHLHNVTAKGDKFHVVVGLMDELPYEVFALKANGVAIPQGDGIIRRLKRGTYVFVVGEDQYLLTDRPTPDQEAITRLASGWMRHRGDVRFVVDQLNAPQGDITSFEKAIARTLKKYIPDGVKSTLVCECGSKNIIFEEGCEKCLNCGSSKC